MQFDDAFPKRLERMLNLRDQSKTHLRAEVLNFGRMGASTISEKQIFNHSLKFHPDLAILEITLNDPEPKNFHQERDKKPGKYNFAELEITPQSHPILYHWKSLAYLLQRIHNSLTFSSLIQYYRDMYLPGPRWTKFIEAINTINRRAQERGVKLAVVVFPLFYTSLDDNYPFADVHKQIDEAVEKLGIPVLDLLPAFSGKSPERMTVLPGENTHPNEIAHRIAAEAIYSWLEKEKMIPAQLIINQRYAKRGIHAKHFVQGS